MVRNRTKRSPQTEILDALRQTILAGQMQPGDPVLEMELVSPQELHENLTGAVQAHDPIVRALEARDAAAVQEAIRVHIETSYAEFLGSAQAYSLSIERQHEVEPCTEPVSQ